MSTNISEEEWIYSEMKSEKKVRFFLLDLFKKKFWIFSKKKLTVSSFKKWVMHGRNFVREINFTKFFRENDFTKKLPSVEFNEDETLPHSLQIYLSKRKTFLESNLKKIYLHLLESVQIRHFFDILCWHSPFSSFFRAFSF